MRNAFLNLFILKASSLLTFRIKLSIVVFPGCQVKLMIIRKKEVKPSVCPAPTVLMGMTSAEEDQPVLK